MFLHYCSLISSPLSICYGSSVSPELILAAGAPPGALIPGAI